MTDELERLTSALADRYAIERELGQGGMATVYLAEDLRLKRKVAIKVLLPDLAGAMGPKRFEREIGTVAQLNHPNILGIHDSGDADGSLYYVMPLVGGESLRDRLDREKQLPVEDALQIAREVCDALSHAHAKDVVHRDIKPANILLEDGRALVADFGIARAISEAGGDNLTRTGTSIGTPTYMSPEQAAGSANIDGRSDVYSLGCVVYEMLAGQPPFMGRSSMSLVAQHITTAPQPVTTFRATVPAGAEAAIERALAKSPADRFSSASKFAEALSAPGVGTQPKAASRRPARVAVVVAGVAMALLALLWQGFGDPAGAGVEWRWMIVADLEGSADEDLRETVQTMLSTSLAQSPAVRILGQDHIDRAIINAGMPDTTRLTEEVAVELAERGRVPAVLAGEVNRVGSSYAISLRVVSPDSGTTVPVTRVAQDDAEFLRAIDDAAKELVSGVEDNPAALGPMRPLEEVLTPSMAALQEYRSLTAEQFMSGDAGPLERAIAIDTAYAAALAELGMMLGNHGQIDSARVVFQRALSHPERMTDDMRLVTEAALQTFEGDLPGAYRTLRAGGRSDGGPNPNNLALTLALLGRFESADSAIQHTKGPFGRAVSTVGNELSGLLALGRFEDARDVLDETAVAFPFLLPTMEIEFHIAQAEWEQAESIALQLNADPTVDFRMQLIAIGVEASALAARGAVGAAAARLQQGSELLDGSPLATLFTQSSSLLSFASGSERPDLPYDTVTAQGRLEASLDAALRGDAVQARRHLGVFQTFPDDAGAALGSAPGVVEAVLASSEGEWDSVIESLTPMEAWTWPHYYANLRGPNLGALVLSLLARAHEATGDLESAAAYYEKLGSPVEIARRMDFYGAGLTYPFAHQRLVVLYAALGQVDDAERHWDVFSETFTNPDPELVHLVDEAREALALARDSR